jgi:eukaryotic-like serine/threonine-protein kinase
MTGAGATGKRPAGVFRHSCRFLFLALIILFFLVPCVPAKVLIVNGTGDTTAVQNIINSTVSGDSVFLAGGVYPGSLTIDRPIVFGALDAANPPEIITDSIHPGITLASDGITLNGVKISGTAPLGLLVRSNNNRISGLTITGFEQGIGLKSASSNVISGNTITNNSIGVQSDRTSRSNIFYLNRFENTEDISSASFENIWFSGRQDYRYGGKDYAGPLGNSWKRYAGTDSNGDGIGDTTYTPFSQQPLQDFVTGTPSVVQSADRAPLVSMPEEYNLVGITNTSGHRITSSETPPPELSGSGPSQNPPQSNPGGQQVSGLPPSAPGSSSAPPQGIIPGLLLQNWWIILIVIAASVVIGVWFERSRRKISPGDSDPLRTLPPRNATLVQVPGQTLPAGSSQQDHPYFMVHLPPLLEKKYPGAEYMGEGGVGRVFRAWDPKENRYIAIKIPVRFDEVTGAQFTKELHIWQGLHHKNIVEVYAANVFPMPYIEMEYIETSLATRKFPLEYETAVRIFTGVAEGLQYAHDLGIVHRDIKPENILVTADDIPKITDWGLAKALADTKHTGLISFSLNYAAPEQLAPNLYGDAGRWTDIYQMGVLFYEMVTGTLPFGGSGMGEVTHAILHANPPSPSIEGKNADLIRGIIAKCMQRRPEERYSSVAEILEELKRLNSGS